VTTIPAPGRFTALPDGQTPRGDGRYVQQQGFSFAATLGCGRSRACPVVGCGLVGRGSGVAGQRVRACEVITGLALRPAASSGRLILMVGADPDPAVRDQAVREAAEIVQAAYREVAGA
jgi:hypothetical protein